MSDTIMNVGILLFLGIIVYGVFKMTGGGRGAMFEGMTDASGNTIAAPTPASNAGGGVTQYLAKLQARVIQYQDQFLITKYRTDYENTVLKMDDLLNCVMLETILAIDPANPTAGFTKLNMLNGAKGALNNVMKFIDASH